LASPVAQRDSGQRLPGSQDVTGQQLTGLSDPPRSHGSQNDMVFVIGSTLPIQIAPSCEQVPRARLVKVGDRGFEMRHRARRDKWVEAAISLFQRRRMRRVVQSCVDHFEFPFRDLA
jgi:hypothetical protein